MMFGWIRWLRMMELWMRMEWELNDEYGIKKDPRNLWEKCAFCVDQVLLDVPQNFEKMHISYGARCLRSNRSPPRSSKELSSLSPKSFGQTEALPEILDSLCLEPERPSVRPKMSPNKLGSLCLELENSRSNQRLA